MPNHNPKATLQMLQKVQNERQQLRKNVSTLPLYDEDENVTQSSHPILSSFLEADNADSLQLMTNYTEKEFFEL